MNIISASRRTDIAAFHSRWFMNRVRAGSVVVRNPYGGTPHEVSLLPEDVHAIVFWTRNFGPMMRYIPELEQRGFHYYVHWSLTSLPELFETHNPPLSVSTRAFRQLSNHIGPEKIIWRYDPIVVSDVTPVQWHIENFACLASKLAGFTTRCYVSFVDFYGKVSRNLERVRREKQVRAFDPDDAVRRNLSVTLGELADLYGMELYACCEDILVNDRIQKGRCVDADLIARLFPERACSVKRNPTREECGCSASRDIGAYDSCPHGCVYCYANRDRSTALRNLRLRNPLSATLLG